MEGGILLGGEISGRYFLFEMEENFLGGTCVRSNHPHTTLRVINICTVGFPFCNIFVSNNVEFDVYQDHTIYPTFLHANMAIVLVFQYMSK